ncbi:hypothetical protein FRB95_010144 [Tulasnella sp. JGI-2019a]|nr:hypothetical protein FRB95_010144 [Tulasnella sp. JGI-2019a]
MVEASKKSSGARAYGSRSCRHLCFGAANQATSVLRTKKGNQICGGGGHTGQNVLGLVHGSKLWPWLYVERRLGHHKPPRRDEHTVSVFIRVVTEVPDALPWQTQFVFRMPSEPGLGRYLGDGVCWALHAVVSKGRSEPCFPWNAEMLAGNALCPSPNHSQLEEATN